VCRFKVRVVYREAVISNGDFRDSRWPGDGGGGQMPYIVRLSSCVDNERCAMKIRAVQ